MKVEQSEEFMAKTFSPIPGLTKSAKNSKKVAKKLQSLCLSPDSKIFN